MALPPHIPIAIKMLPHLIQCAIEKRTTNYEEMTAATGIEARHFSRPLTFIRDYICVTHNLPPLTVIVARKGSVTMSSSFDPQQFAALNLSAFKEMELVMIQKVYDYPNWPAALAGLLKLYGEC